MNEKMFDIEKVKTYWFAEAQEALQVADHLIEKEDYSYALFFGHLAVEKLLKALFVIRRKGTCASDPQFVQISFSRWD